MAKTETKKEKLLRWVNEVHARDGKPLYIELGRYKPFMANTVHALVRDGSVKIVDGSTRRGWVKLGLTQ